MKKMAFELSRLDCLSHLTLFQNFGLIGFFYLFFLFSLISLVSFELILTAITTILAFKGNIYKMDNWIS